MPKVYSSLANPVKFNIFKDGSLKFSVKISGYYGVQNPKTFVLGNIAKTDVTFDELAALKEDRLFQAYLRNGYMAVHIQDMEKDDKARQDTKESYIARGMKPPEQVQNG